MSYYLWVDGDGDTLGRHTHIIAYMRDSPLISQDSLLHGTGYRSVSVRRCYVSEHDGKALRDYENRNEVMEFGHPLALWRYIKQNFKEVTPYGRKRHTANEAKGKRPPRKRQKQSVSKSAIREISASNRNRLSGSLLGRQNDLESTRCPL
jgi:hypothetical protein